MKRWLIYFALLILSIWVGLKIHADPGLLFIRYQGWAIETTLWFGFFGLLFGLGALYLIWGLLAYFIKIPGSLSHYMDVVLKAKSEYEMQAGFAYLLQEKGKLAEKHFEKAAKLKYQPFINYLLAAKANQLIGGKKEQKYIEKAEKHADQGHLKTAFDFYAVQKMLEKEDWAEAFKLTEELYEKDEDSVFLIGVLRKIYTHQKNWPALYELLPKLKKQMQSVDYEKLENQVYIVLLKDAVHESQEAAGLIAFWKKLPRSAQQNASVLLAYANGLMGFGLEGDAETLLSSALKKNYDHALAVYYANMDVPKWDKQIKLIESICNKHFDDVSLWFCLGSLYMKHQLWQQATEAFEKGLKVDPKHKQSLIELGQAFLELGNREKALDSWGRLRG